MILTKEQATAVRVAAETLAPGRSYFYLDFGNTAVSVPEFGLIQVSDGAADEFYHAWDDFTNAYGI